ncbi:antitoxin [Gordonia rhizosphera]|uniref:Antitoxin n=1 Tax=Gordonia rhizosphera NBRC 16068 TaxID=1108045 RepID=K6VAE9_9ACTN|nr:antitoxin [Gordonia rhizosphera]GAB93183.1 hypothetical protein GORHZ_209_00180 [Gordonia rhizosphera NBRC 16068]
MNLSSLVNKAKATLKANPSLIDKGHDAVDGATGGKYTGHVGTARDAVKKAVGAEEQTPGSDEPKQDPPQH